MKNRRGFTLYELLAVVSGLGTVFLTVLFIYVVFHFVMKHW